MLMRLVRRIDHWLHRRRREAELAEEMAFHRAELARRSPAAGGFGNATLAREDARSVWIAPNEAGAPLVPFPADYDHLRAIPARRVVA